MVVVIPKQKNIIINCGLYKNFRYIKKNNAEIFPGNAAVRSSRRNLKKIAFFLDITRVRVNANRLPNKHVSPR